MKLAKAALVDHIKRKPWGDSKMSERFSHTPVLHRSGEASSTK